MHTPRPAPIALIALALPLALPAAAAPPEESFAPGEVTVPCNFQPGAQVTYRYTHQSVNQHPAQGEQRMAAEEQMHIEVIAHSPTRTELDIRTTATDIQPSGNPIIDRVMQKLAELDTKQPLKVVLDRETDQKRVLNISAYLAGQAEALQAVKDEVRKRSPELGDNALAVIDRLGLDPSLVEARVLEPLGPLFDYTCTTLTVGPREYDTTLPNPLGTDPAPATGLASVTATGTEVHIEVTEVVAPRSGVELAKAAAAKTGNVLPPEALAELAGMTVETRSTLEVKVDAATGWVRSWSSEKRMAMGPMVREDSQAMTRVP